MSIMSSGIDKSEKKERSSKTKDKIRDKTITDEEKELRKERKLGRKRDRAEEALLMEQKRRKEEEKAAKLASHQNGEPSESHSREKHHYPRSLIPRVRNEREKSEMMTVAVKKDKSPYARDRERSHDREGRDKHRRSSEGKRR